MISFTTNNVIHGYYIASSLFSLKLWRDIIQSPASWFSRLICENIGRGFVNYLLRRNIETELTRQSLQVDWRQKLDTQRGAVLANELKNNACKLAKWTVQSILAGADNLKFGYVTRYNVKDSSRHVILGTQKFNPVEFGQQINLNMDNAWGVVRCILDLIMAQKVKN